MNIIEFQQTNVYDLGIVDSMGDTITSNCKVKCTRDQAPDCKLFKMFKNLHYVILDVSLREQYLDLQVTHYYFEEDGSPAFLAIYNNSNHETDRHSLGTIQDVVYFGRRGTVQKQENNPDNF